MGNFLTNLAKRSFTAASGIRPRRASLFEPANSVPGTLNDSGDEGSLETTMLREAKVETTAQSEPERDVPDSKRRRSERRPHQIERAVEANLPVQEEESEVQPAVLRPIQPKLSPIEINQSHEKAEEDVAPLRPSAAKLSRNESNLPAPVPLGHEDKTPVEKERSVPATSTIPAIAADLAREQRIPHFREDAQPLSHVTDRTFVVTPLVSPAVRGRKKPSQAVERSQVAAEPTIHVSIGRVEVRAEVESHAPKRAERTTPAVMSLDEYLRRRSRRGGE